MTYVIFHMGLVEEGIRGRGWLRRWGEGYGSRIAVAAARGGGRKGWRRGEEGESVCSVITASAVSRRTAPDCCRCGANATKAYW